MNPDELPAWFAIPTAIILTVAWIVLKIRDAITG